MSSTALPPEVIAEAKRIVEQLTADVPRAYPTAGEETLLVRCRQPGIGLREARGLATNWLPRSANCVSGLGTIPALEHRWRGQR